MSNELIVVVPRQLQVVGLDMVPKMFAGSESAAKRFIEFFTAAIRNKNTRRNYANAVRRFADWCERMEATLREQAAPGRGE